MNRRILFLGAFAGLSAAACTENRAVLTDPVGASAYGYIMANSATNLPRGSVLFKYATTAATGDSIIVGCQLLVAPCAGGLRLSGLDSLTATSYYTAWVGDSLGVSFKRVSGQLESVRTDTTLDALGNVISTTQPAVVIGMASAIQVAGNARTAYTWRFERAGAGLALTDPMQVFLITIESTNNATTPNPARSVLFARRDAAAGSTSRLTSLSFGNYTGDRLLQYLYVATPARGRGVVWGNVLEVNDSTLSRPPMGYYYAVWAVKFVPEGAINGDTLLVGQLTSPWPRRNLSLYDADITRTDPDVVLDLPRSILAGSARISADTVAKLPKGVACTGYDPGINFTCPYKGYTNVWLTLQSKDGTPTRMSPNRVLNGSIPFGVTLGLR